MVIFHDPDLNAYVQQQVNKDPKFSKVIGAACDFKIQGDYNRALEVFNNSGILKDGNLTVVMSASVCYYFLGTLEAINEKVRNLRVVRSNTPKAVLQRMILKHIRELMGHADFVKAQMSHSNNRAYYQNAKIPSEVRSVQGFTQAWDELDSGWPAREAIRKFNREIVVKPNLEDPDVSAAWDLYLAETVMKE